MVNPRRDPPHHRRHGRRHLAAVAQTELNMYDAYDRFDRAEQYAERAIDLNRQTAAECDGITPDNVPVWVALRVENMDGTTNINATINAVCTHIRTLNESAADTVRELCADRDMIADITDQYRTENERLRQSLVDMGKNVDRWAELYRRAMSPRLGNLSEYGTQRLVHDIAFGSEHDAPINRAA